MCRGGKERKYIRKMGKWYEKEEGGKETESRYECRGKEGEHKYRERNLYCV